MSKKTLLFVDDEEMILDGLRRSLRSMRKEWDVEFAVGGKEGVEVMQSKHFDAIVSDLRMPEMDGAQFLANAKQLQPDSVRIVLSGHADRDLAISSARSAHQFLAKPCSVEDLIAVLRSAFELRQVFEQPGLREFAQGADLPKIPKLYDALCEAISGENADLDDIVSIVEQDTSIAARVLQLVNSAFFGVGKNVDSLAQAVSLLGLDMLKAIVLESELLSSVPDLPAEELEALAQRSLKLAQSCDRICKSLGYPDSVRDQAMTAAVLQNIGKLILACAEPPHHVALSERNASCQRAAEVEQLGFTTAELSAYTLALWGLSDAIVEAVCFHQNAKMSSMLEEETPLTTLSAAALAFDIAQGQEPEIDISMLPPSFGPVVEEVQQSLLATD